LKGGGYIRKRGYKTFILPQAGGVKNKVVTTVKKLSPRRTRPFRRGREGVVGKRKRDNVYSIAADVEKEGNDGRL